MWREITPDQLDQIGAPMRRQREPRVTAECSYDAQDLMTIGGGLIRSTPGVHVSVSCHVGGIDEALYMLDKAAADVRRQLCELTARGYVLVAGQEGAQDE